MQLDDALTFLNSASPLRITISGDIGSGKSTFSKHLAEDLDIPRMSIGQLMREEAARRNMTLDALNELLQEDDQLDRDLDALQTERSQEIERGIFEGRTAWHFVTDPKVTIYLKVDPAVSAERIWQDDNSLRDSYASLEELIQGNATRKQSEIDRYQRYYGLDVYDEENFNIVVDTTHLTIEEVYTTAVLAIVNHLQG